MKKILNEDDFVLISPEEALKRFPINDWFKDINVPSFMDSEETIKSRLFHYWGGSQIVLYDGDT
jgi:hypothetical protein